MHLTCWIGSVTVTSADVASSAIVVPSANEAVADYEGLAKTLSSRLRPMLPEIIHKTQTSFVQDHSIISLSLRHLTGPSILDSRWLFYSWTLKRPMIE